MSNFLGVATVTAAIQELLQRAVASDVAGATARTDRPDAKREAGDAIVNIFLYQVVTNAALANADLPTRRSGGSLLQRPRAAVDLHYLISFYGDDSELEPQRMLGSAVAALHAEPLITADLIDAVVTGATANVGAVHPSLALTDLADAEAVRLCPLPLDLEQLSRVWSIMFQTPYALSISWKASVVLLERSETSEPAPPVLTPVLTVRPTSTPRLERVVTTVPGAPITSGSTLRVLGSGLLGDAVTVVVGTVELAPARPGESELDVDLTTAPAGSLRAGTVPVRVVQQRLVGDPPSPRGEIGSNTVGITLHPVVTAATVSGATLQVTTDLTIGVAQSVEVALVDPASGTVLHRSTVPDRQADGTTVSAPLAGVPNGQHAVLVYVDGADSVPTRDASGTITAPLVVVP
jgi:hypothetical protein